MDGDGTTEDLNGNGRTDFDDVRLMFENFESPQVEENPELFDFNGNGRIDFADIIALFTNV